MMRVHIESLAAATSVLQSGLIHVQKNGNQAGVLHNRKSTRRLRQELHRRDLYLESREFKNG